jgi:hypothetical protein
VTNSTPGRHAATKPTPLQRLRAAARAARRRAARTAARYEAWATTTTDWELPA